MTIDLKTRRIEATQSGALLALFTVPSQFLLVLFSYAEFGGFDPGMGTLDDLHDFLQ